MFTVRTLPRQSVRLSVPVAVAVWPRTSSMTYCEITVPPLSSLLRLLVVAASMIMTAPPSMPMVSTMIDASVSMSEKPRWRERRERRMLARPNIVASSVLAAIHPGGDAPCRRYDHGRVICAQHSAVLEQVEEADGIAIVRV